MTRVGVISDSLWAVIEPVMPSSAGRRGRPWNDHRATLEAIAWRFRTGAPWRDIPPELGAWQSIWERHHRWSTDTTYEAMFAAVRAHGGSVEDAELAALWANLWAGPTLRSAASRRVCRVSSPSRPQLPGAPSCRPAANRSARRGPTPAVGAAIPISGAWAHAGRARGTSATATTVRHSPRPAASRMSGRAPVNRIAFAGTRRTVRAAAPRTHGRRRAGRSPVNTEWRLTAWAWAKGA